MFVGTMFLLGVLNTCEFDLFCLTGKRGRLLSQTFAQNPELRRFLATDNTRYLSWLHEIGSGDFNGVSATTIPPLAKQDRVWGF